MAILEKESTEGLQTYDEERREGRRMIPVHEDCIKMLVDRVVKDQIEVHIEMTSENISVDIQPWKPYEMKCPYAERKEHDL
jgi:hypothetical protein